MTSQNMFVGLPRTSICVSIFNLIWECINIILYDALHFIMIVIIIICTVKEGVGLKWNSLLLFGNTQVLYILSSRPSTYPLVF